MSNDKKVCYCSNVSVGDVAKAIKEGAANLEEVQNATHAGHVCGRCTLNVEKVVEELLKENNK